MGVHLLRRGTLYYLANPHPRRLGPPRVTVRCLSRFHRKSTVSFYGYMGLPERSCTCFRQPLLGVVRYMHPSLMPLGRLFHTAVLEHGSRSNAKYPPSTARDSRSQDHPRTCHSNLVDMLYQPPNVFGVNSPLTTTCHGSNTCGVASTPPQRGPYKKVHPTLAASHASEAADDNNWPTAYPIVTRLSGTLLQLVTLAL